MLVSHCFLIHILGLIRMSIEALCLQNECEGELGKQSAAVVFLSVPHHGCPMASITNSAILSALLHPTPELKEMRIGEVFCMKRYLYLSCC